MKTTIELPEEMVRAVKLRAVHEGKKLKELYVELIGRGLSSGANGSSGIVAADEMLKRRREVFNQFLSGELGA